MLTYWIYRGIAALPLRTSYGLARIFAWLTEFVFRYRIKTVDSNLRNAFPDKPEAWYAQTRHAFYQQFAEVAVEALYAWRIPKEELERIMTLKGWEPLMSEEGTPAPGIILALHHTNWEWLTQRASLAARAPFDGVYKPLHDQGADRFALESRGKFGGTLVTMKSIGKYVLKARRANRVLALLADQSPGKKEVAYWTDFLNQPTAFFWDLRRLLASRATPSISQGHDGFLGATMRQNFSNCVRLQAPCQRMNSSNGTLRCPKRRYAFSRKVIYGRIDDGSLSPLKQREKHHRMTQMSSNQTLEFESRK